MATVLQEAPRANFFVLGAHLTHNIDSLISMLTKLLLQWVGPVFLYMKTLLSWLPLIILSSFDQSISEIGCCWSWIYCKSYQESKLEISLTLKIKSLTLFFVAILQNSSDLEKVIAVTWFYWTSLSLDIFWFIVNILSINILTKGW